MKAFIFSSLFIFVMTANAGTLSSDLPAPFIATFELYKSGLLVAETRYQLRKTPEEIRFESNTQLRGLISLFKDASINELSLFDTSSSNKIRLQRYDFLQSGNNRQHINSIIDWTKRRVSTTINNKAATYITFNQTLWDKNSIILALISNADKNLKQLSFQAISQGTIESYNFVNLGLKNIDVNEDEHDEEWKSVSIWQRRYENKSIIFYLDPLINYLPVKIEKFKNQQLEATLWLTELNSNE